MGPTLLPFLKGAWKHILKRQQEILAPCGHTTQTTWDSLVKIPLKISFFKRKHKQKLLRKKKKKVQNFS